MCLYEYNHFHTIQVDSGKIMTSGGYPSLRCLFEGNNFTQQHKILSQKTRDFVVAHITHSEDFVNIACTILKRLKSVTDRQTNKWMYR